MVRLFLLLLVVAPAALAARLEIPLRVPLDTVREALAANVSRELYREGRCRYLNMERPRLEAADGQLRCWGRAKWYCKRPDCATLPTRLPTRLTGVW